MRKIPGAVREREPETYLPYVGHIEPDILLLGDGSLLAMLHLAGVAAETASASAVNSWHAQRNVLYRNIAAAGIVLTTHLVRTLSDGADYPQAPCRSAFAAELDRAYARRLAADRLYRNDLFLSVLVRPAAATLPTGGVVRLFRRAGAAAATPVSIDLLSRTVDQLVASLDPVYGVRRLGLREGEGVLFSEMAEALRLVLTGERHPVPLVDGYLGGAIYTDRVIVGREAIEIRGAGASTYAAALGLREYPAITWPGMCDALLSAPYTHVLTQTFGFLDKQAAQAVMTRKQNQMVVAGDKAASQTEALTEAADDLASNVFAMGDHHLTLVVHADSMDRLKAVTARARRDLAESGAVVTREDLALEAAYWAQLPGNMRLRTRPGAVSSRNFAALGSFHNYPQGPERGHWGEPLTLFRTTGGTAYRFHLHVEDLGNVFVAGPSGSGKTTLILFLLAQAERQGATVVFFDKDRGGEILARALGGTYLILPAGRPTGLAPLRTLSATAADIAFLHRLVRALVSTDGDALTPEQDRLLELGIRAVLALPPEERSFGELRAFLGQADPDGPGARLEKWCAGGSLGWVLDNPVDTVELGATFLGFDMTAVLDDPVTRGPVMAYLFHRVEALVDGRRLVLAIDEFWKALADPAFRDLVNDKLKTIRKQNGAVILATQSPADALRSPIAHSILEQCPTQILMPNGRADPADYIDGLKLTEPEFTAIREDLTAGGRRFLLKQGAASTACELDLGGLDDLVAVLSARTGTVRLMERLIAELGPEPEAWLPRFRREWRAALTGA